MVLHEVRHTLEYVFDYAVAVVYYACSDLDGSCTTEHILNHIHPGLYPSYARKRERELARLRQLSNAPQAYGFDGGPRVTGSSPFAEHIGQRHKVVKADPDQSRHGVDRRYRVGTATLGVSGWLVDVCYIGCELRHDRNPDGLSHDLRELFNQGMYPGHLHPRALNSHVGA